MILDLMFAVLLQSTSITPDLVEIPAGQIELGGWPNFESLPTVGHKTFTYTYTVGPNGMSAGGGIEIGIGYPTTDLSNPAYAINSGWVFGPTNSLSRFPIGSFQTTNPSAPNFCTAIASTGTPAMTTIRRTGMGRDVLLKVTLNEALTRGDTITVKLGVGKGMTLSWTPGCPQVVTFEDPSGSGAYKLSPANRPTILFTGARAERFLVQGPVTALVGRAVRMTIHAVQGHDNPRHEPIVPVATYHADAALSCTDPNVKIQATLTGSAFHGGIAEIPVTFMTPGIQVVTVTEGSPGRSAAQSVAGMSNSVLVEVPDSTEIFCGDLQRHSMEGGHAAVPGDYCWRDLYDDAQDFGTVVQHSETYMSGFEHAKTVLAAFEAIVGDQFIGFPGYEYTLSGSHRHVVYRGPTHDSSITCSTYAGFESPGPTLKTTTKDFLDLLRTMSSDQDHFSIVHHTLWVGHGNWDFPFEWGNMRDDSIQPLVEVFSTRGSSEVWLSAVNSPDDYPMVGDLSQQRPQANLASVRDALKMGYRFGIVAGSDRHAYSTYSAAPTSVNPTYYEYTRGGLAFVRCGPSSGSKRDRIWNGMRLRNVYATTGARIVLNWTTAGGTEMGGQESSTSPSFNLSAHASGIGILSRPLFLKLNVVRDDEVVTTSQLSSSDIDWRWTDQKPIRDGKHHSYYVRLVQDDFHVAWSSPIWVLAS